MAENHKTLYEAAQELNVQVAEFAHYYDGVTGFMTRAVYPNSAIEDALNTMREKIGTILREIVADAFDEGELAFPPSDEPVEGGENVHRNDNLFVAPTPVGNNISEFTIRSSPVRMTSIL